MLSTLARLSYTVFSLYSAGYLNRTLRFAAANRNPHVTEITRFRSTNHGFLFASALTSAWTFFKI